MASAAGPEHQWGPGMHAVDRLVPEDYRPRISEEERATLPYYGGIVARLHEAWAQSVDFDAPVPVTDALDLLALTADYPVEHPLRQAAAHWTTRLALAEGRIATAAAVLEEGIRELAVTSEPEHPSMSKALEILKR